MWPCCPVHWNLHGVSASTSPFQGVGTGSTPVADKQPIINFLVQLHIAGSIAVHMFRSSNLHCIFS